MKLRVRSWRCLIAAIAYVLVGAEEYFDRDGGGGPSWHHYGWVIFLLGAGIFFFRAFSPAQSKPEPDQPRS